MTEKLIYDVVAGYMLKIIKSQKPIDKFKSEFNAIRHGDYLSLINFVGIGIPTDVVVSHEGEIISSENQLEIQNADFLRLILSGPSLIIFFEKCFLEFGNFTDSDLSEEDFQNLANFEMSLRLHLNNIITTNTRIDLVEVISLLGEALNIPGNEIAVIQKGREFLNMVKGHKAKFSSFDNGLLAFNLAREVLSKYELIVTSD